MRLAVASGFFVGGIALAAAAGFSPQQSVFNWLLPVMITTLALSVLLQARKGARVALTLAALLLVLGFARGLYAEQSPNSDWIGVPSDRAEIDAVAWLEDDARKSASGVRLRLRAVSVDGQTADFPLTAFASGLTDLTGSGRSSSGFRYGDVYRISGRFAVSSPEFADQSAGTVFTSVVSLIAADRGNPARRGVAGVREALSSNLSEVMRDPASSLARTMLVNDRTGLAEELTADFRESGTAHLLAISGLHVALIGGLALVASVALVGRRGQYYLLVPLIVTWGYAALAGFSPSVTRAAIMFSVFLLARAAGRQNASLPGIGFAAALMVAVSPEILQSLSFQLSFAAITGIAVLSPRIIEASNRRLPASWSPEADRNGFVDAAVASVAVSVAATLATWPLIALNFGGAPIWGGLATIVMLPAVPILIVTSGIASIAAEVSSSLAEVFSWPAWLLGGFIAEAAAFFRSVPPGIIETPGWSAWTVLLAYVLIFAAFSWKTLGGRAGWARSELGRFRQIPLADRSFVYSGVPIWVVGVAAIAAILTWTGAVTAANSDELSVTFFETDRGDIILIRTPNGNSVLIDGGRDPLGAVGSLDREMPFWDRSLDMLLVTHPDADHIGGLQAVIERYEVGIVAEAPTSHSSNLHSAWQRALADGDHATVDLVPGTVIGIDDGVALEILAGGPPFPDASINDASVVAMLRYGDFSALLTGDITSLVERRLLGSGHDLRSTVLKVPHHGSDTSSTQEFLNAVEPEVAIVQVGNDNRFGHPTSDVLERLESVVSEDRIFVTSQHGEVTVRTDGEKVRVEAER